MLIFIVNMLKILDAVLSEQDIKNNECMKSLLYAMILDYKFSQE